MSEPVKLLFGVHAHQPAGNFPKVVREARERCYGPFFEVVERHPEFKFSLHVSGWLLGFLAREFPGDIDRIRAMVARGQAEIFGGGDAEPILAALSETDRRDQIGAMNARLRRTFGLRPRGAWLAERVWEATVVPSLVGRGIRYVAVDDYHFLCAGQPPESLGGYFTTEEGGKRLDLFPISETLRYTFPFAPAHEAIAHLESLPRGAAAIYFDDIEKFGIWPETHDWVYGRRWLEDFIDGVARSPSIETLHYADFHASHRARGIVYLPTVSYAEMGEWTLPPRGAERFAQLVERSKRETSFAEDKPLIRGGHWRNFFTRYPESNRMHKRVSDASRRLHALPRASRTAPMLDDLRLAQANDAYWHGLFGGIYLPHLRRQVYSSLARLEGLLDRAAPRAALEVVDVDLDGRDEVVLANRALLAVVRPADGLSVGELTHYALAHNFADTLARRHEHYHGRMQSVEAYTTASAPASIHERVGFRTAIGADELEVDVEPRALFVDFFAPAEGGATYLSYASVETSKASVRSTAVAGGLTVVKHVRLMADGVVAGYELRPAAGAGPLPGGTWTVRVDVAMPSCDGPGGSYRVAGHEPCGLASTTRWEGASAIELADAELGGSLVVEATPPATVEARPLSTASQSEAGFEKIMQASTLRISWPLALGAGDGLTLSVRLRVKRW